ncbi:MAG: 3-hydroxyacyl-CoA dehydrogenase family protein [Thermoplasmata archaeon]
MWFGKTAVVGAGIMGHGIAEVLAYCGFNVILKDVDERLVQDGINRISAILQKRVDTGKMTPEQKNEILGRIRGTTTYDEFEDVDVVIEAVVEDMEIKKKVFKALDGVCPPKTIFATNTSSLSISELGASTNRPRKVIGMHFFNPAPVMKLVEVVPGMDTSRETVDAIVDLAERCRKIPVVVKESPGFLVNRLLIPVLLEAIRALDEGIAPARDIDLAMKAGAGFPMGPFELADMVGIDICLETAENMYQEFGDPRFAPPPRLRNMVKAGRLGRKTGRGFFEYTEEVE